MAPSKIAIVVDSTATLPQDLIKKHNIHVMPLRVNWPGEEVQSLEDIKEINPGEFFERLKNSDQIPTTSQPSPGEFVKFFSQVGKESKEIVAILISEKLSGTYRSAQFALNMVDELDIELVDSKNLGLGLALIALKAAEAAEAGKSLKEVAEVARESAKHARLWFVPETLEYLHKGGRLSGTKKLIGTLLDMKPLLHVVDGSLELFGTVRNVDKAVDNMLDIVEVEIKNKEDLWIGVPHADAPEMMEYIEGQVRERFKPKRILKNEVSPAIGVHIGPGAVGLAHLGEG